VKPKHFPPHPTVHLLLYLVVPLAINVLCAVHMKDLFPLGGTLVLRGGGMLFVVSWGWAGLFVCMLLGVLFGLPIAGLQAAYLRSRVARVERGAPVQTLLTLDPWLAGPWPWLAASVVAFAVGWVWVFPPLGGPLVAVNVMWARTLIYRPELLVFEYWQAEEELKREEEARTADLLHLPDSA